MLFWAKDQSDILFIYFISGIGVGVLRADNGIGISIFGGNVKKKIHFCIANDVFIWHSLKHWPAVSCWREPDHMLCFHKRVFFFFICILMIRLELTAANGRFS